MVTAVVKLADASGEREFISRAIDLTEAGAGRHESNKNIFDRMGGSVATSDRLTIKVGDIYCLTSEVQTVGDMARVSAFQGGNRERVVLPRAAIMRSNVELNGVPADAGLPLAAA
jgi:hypothetical protein